MASAAKKVVDDDDDDDLFVDAVTETTVVPTVPVAPPRKKKESMPGGPRAAAPSAGIPNVLATVPELSARNIAFDSTAVVCDTCTTFVTPQAFQTMTEGGTMFMLRSGVGTTLTDADKYFIDAIINNTMFKDELAENNSPKVDIFDPAFAASITAVMVKTQYLVKGWRAENFTANFVASYDYQSACQPGKPSHVADLPPGMMRFTKTIIPVVYKVTIQFSVSEITSPEAIATLEEMTGLRVDKAILLERTKRRIEIVDATLKCKSVLLYHNLADGSGVLVVGCTAILNTQIPAIAAKVLSNSSGLASREAAETAKLTRTFLASAQPPK